MVTLDTNVAVYALTLDAKRSRAREILRSVDFVSVQVLNEYANVARRKLGRSWEVVAGDLDALRQAAGVIRPVTDDANREAIRIGARYRITFYDAVIVAVALANGARVLYSEDMQHGLVIDGCLSITDPFLESA